MKSDPGYKRRQTIALSFAALFLGLGTLWWIQASGQDLAPHTPAFLRIAGMFSFGLVALCWSGSEWWKLMMERDAEHRAEMRARLEELKAERAARHAKR